MADADPDDGGVGHGVVTVLDRFLSVGISREKLDAHLAAGRIAVAGQGITGPTTLHRYRLPVAIMFDP